MKSKDLIGKMANNAGQTGKAMSSDAAKLRQTVNDNKVKNNQLHKNGGNASTSVSDEKNNQEDGQKNSKGKQLEQAGGTEAARAGLQALAASYGIPKPISDPVINKFLDSKAGQETIEKALKKLKTKIMMMVLSAAASLAMSIIMIGAMYGLIATPVGWVGDALEGIGDFFSSMWNWFSGDGWCSGNECQQNATAEYYDYLEKAVKKYNKEHSTCKINENLITATIFYGQMVSEKKIESDSDSDSEETDNTESYYDFLDVKEGMGSPHASELIYLLTSVYLKGENKSKEDLDSYKELEIEIDENSSCSISAVSYRDYLIKTYIDWAYPSVVKQLMEKKDRTEKEAKEIIADEILRMGDIVFQNGIYSSSIYCDSISVEQEDGNIESMEFEDYIARVVTNENRWHQGDNIESMKALAIAARTYALNRTENCKKTIKNSETAQTVASTPTAEATRATQETANLVLLKDGKVFSSQYDGLAIDFEKTNQKNDGNYYIMQADLAVPKSWIHSQMSDEDFDRLTKYWHGNGMSQWGANYLQHLGKNYEEILETFYPDAEISRMNLGMTIIKETDGLFVMLPGGNSYSVTSNPANCRCHPTKKMYESHRGVDIGAEYGTEILAFEDGIVDQITVATKISCGSSIIRLKHIDKNGDIYYTRYVHLNRNSNQLLKSLKKGDAVKKGQVIGYVGGVKTEDSCSTGSHLEFAMLDSDEKPINPLVALNNYKNGLPILSNKELIIACVKKGAC